MRARPVCTGGMIALAFAAAIACAWPVMTAAEIKPIETLWLAPMPPFTATEAADAAAEKVRIFKAWREAQVFDAVVLLNLPPTYVDYHGSAARVNALAEEAGIPFIVATLPVGTEGWEPSCNERFATRATGLGARYDASKAMSQARWLETLKGMHGDRWAWVLEHQARFPTADEASRSLAEFVRITRSRHKKPVVWLSGQALTHGRQFEELMKRICEAARADADAFVWMDLPAEVTRGGEANWRQSLEGMLDRILALSPREKTVIQWMNNPQWPTRDVEGTKAYIGACQGKGINRFCVLARPQSLEQDPWREFYRAIPKAAAAK